MTSVGSTAAYPVVPAQGTGAPDGCGESACPLPPCATAGRSTAHCIAGLAASAADDPDEDDEEHAKHAEEAPTIANARHLGPMVQPHNRWLIWLDQLTRDLMARNQAAQRGRHVLMV